MNSIGKLEVFDGCTEFGSETQAFKDRGHDVTTLGLEGNVDIKIDIRDFHTKNRYDFMWFSPPCTEFSIADYRKGACKNRNPDLTILQACFRIIQETTPTFWIIENPRGCMRYFIKKLYGLKPITIEYGDYGHWCRKPTDLWGVFPWFFSQTPRLKNYKSAQNWITGFTPEQKKKRSEVPYNLGLALCLAIEDALKAEGGKDSSQLFTHA